ncbi:MAG: hypothetical protein ACXWLM_10325, partial [Myxococcales bacterium]
MTSSASSSSSLLALALLAAAGASAAAQAPPAPGRFALFPAANLSGAVAPVQELEAMLEKELRDRGVPLVSGDAVDAFLAERRIRYTAGLSPDDALAARNALGVTGVLIATVTAYQRDPPRLGLELRLVSADLKPRILWADGVFRAGDESPGLFELGVITDPNLLARRVFGDLAGSLATFLKGSGPAARACPSSGRFSPQVSFRAPSLDPAATLTVAVLPFVNETPRRNAGDLLSLIFVRQLLAGGRFRVVEPGAVRDELLRFRIVMEGGVSLDTARIVMELMQADLVLAGTVRTYADPNGGAGAPSVQFGAILLDRKNNEVLWESSSDSKGD